MVSAKISRMALNWHDILGKVIMLMVVLHVATILFYRLWKREDLIRPMIVGWKRVCGRK